MTIQGAFRVNDTVLWVEDSGETDLPVVLCLHSLFLDRRMFSDFAERMRGRFRTIRPDFRGQGKSAPATEALIDMDTCASDMLRLLDALGVSHCSVLAQSMGGDVAIRMLARRPKLFDRIVLAGSSARNEPADQLDAFRTWVDDACTDGFAGETLDFTMRVMFGKSTRNDPAQAEMLKLWSGRIAALPLSLRPAMSGVIERGDARPYLPLIEQPVLILSGSEDMPRPPEWADEVAAGLPNGKLVRLDGIGHSPTLEVPDKVMPQIAAFFEGCSV